MKAHEVIAALKEAVVAMGPEKPVLFREGVLFVQADNDDAHMPSWEWDEHRMAWRLEQ